MTTTTTITMTTTPVLFWLIHSVSILLTRARSKLFLLLLTISSSVVQINSIKCWLQWLLLSSQQHRSTELSSSQILLWQSLWLCLSMNMLSLQAIWALMKERKRMRKRKTKKKNKTVLKFKRLFFFFLTENSNETELLSKHWDCKF